MNETESTTHTLYLLDRQTLHLNGVEEVVSFDEQSVVLKTLLGTLSVDGEQLHVRRLDTERGEVSIEGRLCGMLYVDLPGGQEKKKTRGLGRLFH